MANESQEEKVDPRIMNLRRDRGDETAPDEELEVPVEEEPKADLGYN